ncbi:uncharacterized protein PRCAT00005315001 [Priceomyces carsonii]|uniref:uncharacterized protein n=1 Tax=Priceomyces carsonii TaxID=28549 RepID=UPI002ED943BF|nr:unnamed protein product [Priceomyces carsonii]
MHTSSNSSAVSLNDASQDREVLPSNIKPLHYKLTLEPNFDTFKFDGQVAIDFLINERTNYITLNLLDIEIHEAKVNDVTADGIEYDTDRQTVTFRFEDHLIEGREAKLHIKYTGELNDKMAGFYRSSYEENGKTKYLATTQMEATDCRRAFPCYDEPSAKAKFTISLIADMSLIALSNMDEKDTTLIGDNKKRVDFKTTPLMSTYLVAFIVGDLKYVENNDFRVPIKVYSTPGSEKLGQYAADIGAKTLAFFESKFDIPYPLPKCDMVAIHDFASGAMENFGLITYRTADLLLDPSNANINTKHRVTEVVMHELAHQWFGNLVTMDFWDGLWLNEGFATWMSWYACNALYPEWNVWESYVSDTLQSALSLDSLRSSHPIEVPVKKVDEINQIFDAISYSKGSAVLKMVSRWLGEEVFIKGVAKYLQRHKWGNTRTSDLWEALSEQSGKDVVKVMDIWTKNVGFPVIKVEEEKGELKVSQNRFLATNDVKPEEDKVLYPVFLGLKTSQGTDESLVLDSRTKSFKLDVKDDFFKINGDLVGIYRTVYEPSRWAKLGKAGLTGKLSIEDRTGLVADAGSLASCGLIQTVDLLNLIKLWSSETSYVVWDQILGKINSLKAVMRFEEESVTTALNLFALDLISKNLNEIGWDIQESDSFSEKQLKSSLFGTAVSAGHKGAIEYSRKSFDAYVNGDKKALKADLRPAIFSCVAKYGDNLDFEKILNIYKNPDSVEEKMSALRTLGKFRQPDVIEKVIALLLDTKVIKSQDVYGPLVGFMSHKLGIERIWKWLKENWLTIVETFPPSLPMLGIIVKICVAGFTKASQKSEVENFFSGKDKKGFNQSLAQALEMITTKSNWASRDRQNVTNWLSTNGYSK